MTYDFSLQDVMGNFTGGAVDPSMDTVSTATTQVSEIPQPKEYINPKFLLKTAPVAPANPLEAPAPAVPSGYNASIAQQESGGRPDIGFHDKKKSTAYGTYGLTSGAYQDARKLNPNLPADITQATPEQQTQAQDAYTQQNAKYLQSYGVEVNPNTLAAAHFLGAKGLADYLRDGTISPAAAKANGGEDKVREIVNKRLGGQAAPASGAVQPAAAGAAPAEPTVAAVSPEAAAAAAQPPAPAAEAYTGQGLKIGGQTQQQLQQQKAYDTVLNSNSTEQIGKMAFDLNTPKDIQRAALDKLHNTMAVEQGMNRAKQVMADLGANPDQRALNKAMNDRDTGSYLKVLMYQAMGWTSKAKEELDKIDPKTAYGQTSLNGVNYRTKVNPNTNEILAAWDADGNPADQKTLNRIGAEGFNAKAMGNVKELVKVGDKTIGVYQDGSMIDLATKQRYTGSLAGAEKIVGSGIEGGETGLVDPTTNIGGYSRAYENNKLVIRDAAGKIVSDPEIASRIIKTGVGGETPAQKAMNKRVEAALEQLSKDYSVPTEQQKIDALRKRAVPDNVIEEKLGLAPGALKAPSKPAGAAVPTGPAPAAPISPTQAAQPVPQVAAPAPAQAAPAGAKPVAAGIGPKPSQPEFRPQQPGESNNAYKDYKKSIQDLYEGELDVWKKKQDRIEKKAEDLPRIQAQAQESIATVADLLSHPGFSDVIGVPNVITGIYSPPGTDARDFKSKYKQLLGEQFLSAYNSLRGGGAITDFEGQQAKEAVAAMQDPYISEAEFKRNAQLYIDTMKRGVNRQRAEVGLPPQYADVPEPGQRNKPAAGGTTREGQTSTSKSGKPIIYRNGRWEYQ